MSKPELRLRLRWLRSFGFRASFVIRDSTFDIHDRMPLESIHMIDKESAPMGWLSDIARSLGLMIHNIRHPDQAKGVKPGSQRRVVRKDVEEHREGKMTLRRTTIEEIEIHPTETTDDDRKDDHGS